ncbi:MAG: endolytic transglycosylase MltG [Acidimicrobiales bacterium]
MLLAAVLSVLVAGGGLGWWAYREVNPSGGPGAEISVVIPPGSSDARVASLLERAGVISDAGLFRLYLSYEGSGPFRSGTYRLRRHDRFSHVVALLAAGAAVIPDRIVIPEGFTLAQIADRVGRLPGRSAARFLTVATDGEVRSPFQPPGSTSLEGLLFPATYFVSPQEDEAAIMRRMVDAFDQQASDAGLSAGAAVNGMTPYAAVIVASMVEREAKVPEDRGRIARVIDNRLARGMALQVDATVQYALGHQRMRLTDADLKVASPFNTYRFKGLPPTPIASPGRAALDAALHPTPGPWLYYVLAQADGHHAFATTEAEFEVLKAQAHAHGLL